MYILLKKISSLFVSHTSWHSSCETTNDFRLSCRALLHYNNDNRKCIRDTIATTTNGCFVVDVWLIYMISRISNLLLQWNEVFRFNKHFQSPAVCNTCLNNKMNSQYNAIARSTRENRYSCKDAMSSVQHYVHAILIIPQPHETNAFVFEECVPYYQNT